MNYYGAVQLAASFRTVRQNTIQIAEEIPEAQYGFCPAEGTRSITGTLAHIAVFPQFQLLLHAGEARSNFEGVDFMAMMKSLAEQEATARTPAPRCGCATRSRWKRAAPSSFPTTWAG